MDNNDRIWVADLKNNAAWDRLTISDDEVRHLYQNARLTHHGPWRNS